MYILPVPLPGETLLGYCVRAALLSCRASMKATALHFFDRTALQAPLILPGNVAHVVSRTYGVLAITLEELVDRHTLFPVFSPFLSDAACLAIWEHFNGTSQIRSPFMYLGIATAAGAPKQYHVFCPECVKAQIKKLGFPYWKRMHQVPYQRVCPWHGVQLSAGCGNCRYSEPANRYLQLPPPNGTCWCGQPIQPLYGHFRTEDEYAFCLRYAKATLALLHWSAFLRGRRTAIGNAYYYQARNFGYVENGRVPHQVLIHDFEAKISDEALRFYGGPYADERSWLIKALRTGEVPVSLTRNILAIDFLFGSVEEFVKQVRKSESAIQSTESSARKDLERRVAAERLEKCKRDLVRYVERYPGANRTKVLRALGRTATDLREQCRDWYEANMPATAERKGRAETYTTQYLLEQADDLEGYITDRYHKQMDEDAAPRPITKKYLLHGHSLQARFDEVSAVAPDFAKRVESLLETTDDFKRRRALWMLLNSKAVGGADLVEFVARRVGLRISYVQALLEGMSVHPY